MFIVLAIAGVVFMLCGGGVALFAALRKTPATTAPVDSSTATPTNPIKDKLKTTLVQLEQNGMKNMATFLKNLWAGNKDQVIQDLELEAEHLAQGGPSLVLADIETMFAKTLASKLTDSDAAQAVLNQIYTTLGPSHPALVAFAQSILPTKPTLASTPATAAGTK